MYKDIKCTCLFINISMQISVYDSISSLSHILNAYDILFSYLSLTY